MKNNRFLKRMFAYFLDMLIIGLVLGFITALLPPTENSKKLMLEQETIANDFVDNKIEIKEFINRSIEIEYDQAREKIPIVIINVAGLLFYFVVFQAYNKGQTLGKKLMKLKVTSHNGTALGLNDYFKRVFIAPPVLWNLLDLVLLMFSRKKIYLTSNIVLNVIQNLLLILSGFMIIYRKDGRGLHDLIANTKVVEKGDVEK